MLVAYVVHARYMREHRCSPRMIVVAWLAASHNLLTLPQVNESSLQVCNSFYILRVRVFLSERHRAVLQFARFQSRLLNYEKRSRCSKYHMSSKSRPACA